MILALVRSMRPKQWTKNLLVFAGFLFTVEEKHAPGDFGRVLLAFGVFCLVSSSVYILNDVVDKSRDRHHPIKRKRPIAAGLLPVPVALLSATLLLAFSVLGSLWLDPYFLAVLLGYFALTTAYTLKLKHVVIVDLLVLASGFVLRAVAGAVALNVMISPWLLLCTTLLALFIGLAKRRHELVTLDEKAISHRKILNDYSVSFLDQMINITSAVALMAYSLYTFSGISRTGSRHPYMMVTIPFVIYGIFRYLYLIHNKNAGGHPEQVLLDDRPLLFNLILWAVAVVVILRWPDIASIITRFI